MLYTIEMSKCLDIIVFGASGFTGKYCIRALQRFTTKFGSGETIKWGIAGRSETKLKEALAECQEKLGDNAHIMDVPIIVADLDNYDSLTKMTNCARVIVNCCGPYRFYGEPVIKACIETGTHQVDVSGEPEFMERIQLKYHKLAREKGIYIISSCGFDSVVTDLGVIFLEQNFEGTLNSVECFLEQNNSEEGYSTAMFNVGTWESLIQSFGNANELKDIRSRLFKERLPKLLPKLKDRPICKHNDFSDNSYIVPLQSADRSVVLRTQRYLFEHKHKRPIQFKAYLCVPTKRGLFLMALLGGIFQFLAQLEFGRKLLLKFPDFFTNGYCTQAENLTEEKLDKIKLTLKMLGTGWDQHAPKLGSDNYNFKDLPNKKVIGTIEGYNPAYGIASAAVVLSALTILLESNKLPPGGGVFTPGAAFAETSLINKLQKSNILDFSIKSKL